MHIQGGHKVTHQCLHCNTMFYNVTLVRDFAATLYITKQSAVSNFHCIEVFSLEKNTQTKKITSIPTIKIVYGFCRINLFCELDCIRVNFCYLVSFISDAKIDTKAKQKN